MLQGEVFDSLDENEKARNAYREALSNFEPYTDFNPIWAAEAARRAALGGLFQVPRSNFDDLASDTYEDLAFLVQSAIRL